MKTNMNTAVLSLVLLLCTSVSIFAQSDDILDQVDDTKAYTTIDLVMMDKNLTTFAQLVNMAGMTDQLEKAGEHTLFAPTNKAFEKMSVERFGELIDPDNKAELIAFIQSYYLPNKHMKYDFKEDDVIQTGFDKGVEVAVEGRETGNDEVTLGGASIVKADIEASNGILDVVDGIMVVSNNTLGN